LNLYYSLFKNQHLKIAIVVNSFPETSETFIINKVLAMAAKGNSIDVIRLSCFGNNELSVLYNFSNLENLRIINPRLPSSVATLLTFFANHPIISFQSFSFDKKKFYQNIRKKIYGRIFNNSRYDIIHFEYSGIAASLGDIIGNIKAKTVVSCRGSAEKVKLITEKGRREKIEKIFKIISAVHCVSEDMKKTIAPFCTDLNKVFVNRPAIDVSFFKPSGEKKKNGVLQILSVGRFTYQKGYLTGLMAIREIVAKGRSFVWNIIGDGPQYEEILFHIHNMALENHVKLLGRRNKDEVNSLLAAADIFLLTSVYEGIPNVVLEAMAMELPVVATRSGGVDEVITNGKDGFVADVYDVHEIIRLVELLLSDENLRVSIGKEARKRILLDYTLERQAQVFQSRYQSLLT